MGWAEDWQSKENQDEAARTIVRERFTNDGGLGKTDHGELVRLKAAGWSESCPSENAWHFDHPDFKATVTWHFTRGVEVSLFNSAHDTK